MADRDPNLPQSADPELQADLVRLLQVQGPLGLLNVLDVVIPTVSMGQVVPLNVEVRQPAFRSTDIFSAGIIAIPAAGAILADTTALAAGVYDVKVEASGELAFSSGTVGLALEHRNAANAANLMRIEYAWITGTQGHIATPATSFGYEIGLNERLRLINITVAAAGDEVSGVIFARRRG